MDPAPLELAAAPASARDRAYRVKEMHLTLQGEGIHAGRAAVFLRFAGCNLWSGREADRATAACRFCDTDFVGTDGPGGGTFRGPEALADAAAECWGRRSEHRFVVCTGGEPLLQLDGPAIAALRARGFEVAVETNGTRPLPDPAPDWVTVSPKAGQPLALGGGDELKLVYPQPALRPESLNALGFRHRLLQPMDGPAQAENTQLAVAYCLANPAWRLSVQTHKVIGIA
ncbi:7-carboxy-7-deazaguanine synthase [Phycisphaera mikurensis]|uniref:7-carboxy-7-deazaguanine synthase n=1 Tax=Phycisphaera mikurensis (strain NBRC 102666 / KCTC 22515 / FYK2301M01) TaxID=1142394 RepID=I0IBM6_PHYMF|nr:7-carboxy-7-deazaguanine synthase [Phycisphaera mikurensis]MBB6442807.1 7-carboxy-7-deazaguanine synthase (Cx14CxxC type) [Phycisphaera mikurensis]BAM02664.1 hypothetical protein PSMK_05050 [Phycisphaera mikurensis NBRC 102666]